LWQGGAQLLGPLFYWQQNQRRVDIERAATDEAAHQYRKVVLNAFREVDDATTTINTLKDEIVASESRVTAAKNGERLSTERYNKGVTSYLEVLESQRQSFDAQLNLAQTRQELLSAYILLYKALGGGWLSEEEEKAAQEEEQN
jgi:multidrug efflux system outer membrane protein